MSRRILIDLDGVVVDLMGYALKAGLLDHYPCRWDFAEHCAADGRTQDDVFGHPELFDVAPPIPGAVDGVNDLIGAGLDVLFVSTPWRSAPQSATAKLQWVERYFGPDLASATILTSDKTLVVGDVLVDDKPQITGRVTPPTWTQWIYPQPWNTSGHPTWVNGLATNIVRRWPVAS